MTVFQSAWSAQDPLLTARATARLRACSDLAAGMLTASATAASTVACHVRKSLAVNSPAVPSLM